MLTKRQQSSKISPLLSHSKATRVLQFEGAGNSNSCTQNTYCTILFFNETALLLFRPQNQQNWSIFRI